MTVAEIQEELVRLQDEEYKEFHARLIPTVNPDTVIGVRMPELRKFAKRLKRDSDVSDFLGDLPHRYYEENNLHALLVAEIGDYDECVRELDKFLPYVDNWATCDSLRPKCFKRYRKELEAQIYKWLGSKDTYTIRFAIEMLMVHFLDEDFDERFLEDVASVQSSEYYINMMVAWYFATALAKQWDAAIGFIEQRRLEAWTHNKAIQKAIESYRITPQRKNDLRTLRIRT